MRWRPSSPHRKGRRSLETLPDVGGGNPPPGGRKSLKTKKRDYWEEIISVVEESLVVEVESLSSPLLM